MATASAGQSFQATVHQAESCWYDTRRWPSWVDGLAEVLLVDPEWPAVGAEVVWQSVPAGRGRVRERVVAHEPLGGQTVELEDESITGRQRVSFAPEGQGVEVALTLTYEVKSRSLITPLVDVLFIRRAMSASLSRTLSRFGTELTAKRPLG